MDKLYDNDLTFQDILMDPDILCKIYNKGSRKYLNIVNSIEKVKTGNQSTSVFELNRFGLSHSLVQKLYKRNLTIEILKTTSEQDMKQKYKIGTASYKKIKESLESYLTTQQQIKPHSYTDYLYQKLKSIYQFQLFSQEDAFHEMKKDETYPIIFFQNDFKNLEKNKVIKKNQTSYYLIYPTFQSYLATYKKEKYRYIIAEKLKGRTLETIGHDIEITRERVRQIVAKVFTNLPLVEEDRYRELFEQYDFSLSSFCHIFKVDSTTYYYLKERYNMGSHELAELLDTNLLMDEQKQALRKACHMIPYYGENVFITKSSLFEAILKQRKVQTSIEDLAQEYNQIIKNYHLEEKTERIDLNSLRNMEAVLSRSKNVVLSLNRMYRYYDFSRLTESDINCLQKTLILNAGAYSAGFIFRNKSNLMMNLDIHNEYELHNILRSINKDPKIVFTRMPDFLISCSDKIHFLKEKAYELSPIEIEDYLDYLYINYGHKKDSIRSLVIGSLYPFFIDNKINCKVKKRTKKQETRLLR